MKKYLFIIVFVPILFNACYEGEVGPREDYIVSGDIYYPDGTPLAFSGVNVIDTQFYSHAFSGTIPTEKEYGCGGADKNGHFEIVIPNGGKRGICVEADFQPKCDTAEVNFHYHGELNKRYTDKHCFENLQIYTYIVEHPQRYPYCVPSYPFIGDSVLVVAQEPIEKIHLLEKNTELFSMEYNTGDTAVMFFLPETLSIEKQYYLDIYCVTEQGYHFIGINLNHLRKHEE